MRKMFRRIKWVVRKSMSFTVFLVFFVILLISELILCSKASFVDFFTSETVSALKDCPSDISRNIIVDASEITSDKGGIKTLTENIIEGISRQRPDWRLIVLSNKNIKHPFEFKHENVKVLYVEYTPMTKSLVITRDVLNILSLGYFKDQLTQLLSFNNIYFNANSCDLFFDPYAEHTVNDYSIPKISLIHDIMYADMPEFYGSEARRLEDLRENAKRIVKSSEKIITVSKFSKRRIMKNYGVDANFVRAIHIKLANRIKDERNAEFDKKCLKKFGLAPQKYLIYPSMVRRRKNHKGLFVAFAKYLQHHPSSRIKLAIVGMIKPQVIDELMNLIDESCENDLQSERIKDQIVFTQFVSDKVLDTLLSNALSMIFPSLYEGFGMPIIEAMSAGVPVACSNVTSLPEVAGNAAMFFDPYDIDDIADAIDSLVSDEELRQELIRRGYKRAKKFSDMDSMIGKYVQTFERYMKKQPEDLQNTNYQIQD